MKELSGLTVATAADADGTPVVKLVGELDLATADSVARAMESVVSADGSGQALVIDATELSFMDSSGLAVLLTVVKRGCTVRLRRPTSEVRRLIMATGLSQALPVED